MRRAQNAQGIVHRELSGNSKPNAGAFLPVFCGEFHAVGMEHRMFGPQVILGGFAIGYRLAGRRFRRIFSVAASSPLNTPMSQRRNSIALAFRYSSMVLWKSR